MPIFDAKIPDPVSNNDKKKNAMANPNFMVKTLPSVPEDWSPIHNGYVWVIRVYKHTAYSIHTCAISSYGEFLWFPEDRYISY